MIDHKTRLCELERALAVRGAKVVSLGWNGEEYTCRFRQRYGNRSYFGVGSSITAALSSAFDEMIVEGQRSKEDA